VGKARADAWREKRRLGPYAPKRRIAELEVLVVKVVPRESWPLWLQEKITPAEALKRWPAK
jgi:hypothetical protein